MYYGYCRIPHSAGGGWTSAVELETPQDVWSYINLQKTLFPEVRITDVDDYIVAHAQAGRIVFPHKWAEKEKA
ncbi:hypothetical protein DNHGIG_25500 [Collibacillus ludicampi]|uniref:Uncharacterized protein n=1 Tax=Collibacillus ludicampi TaxID=2771369 RepID=A0AAV4LGP5_9BACL|nr:hypothetical protein [Collibacillus ludicampi]GIM47001.1 hypothetical protein DNHGIG_25500 [Collibacillus ludicampi]